jgi:hypothetical protein
MNKQTPQSQVFPPDGEQYMLVSDPWSGWIVEMRRILPIQRPVQLTSTS